MSKLVPKLTDVLRAVGLRPTAQRSAVLEALVREPVHLTAEEIRRTVNRVDPRASRATVYNNLHLLIKAGLVREVMSDGQAARYDAGLHRHHHFLCDVCGAIEDVAWFDVPATAAKAALGRRVARDYEVVFRGTCEACGNSGAKRGKRL